jgi:hypothetical protein
MRTLSYFCKYMLVIGYVWVRSAIWKNEERKENNAKTKNIMDSEAIIGIVLKKSEKVRIELGSPAP